MDEIRCVEEYPKERCVVSFSIVVITHPEQNYTRETPKCGAEESRRINAQTVALGVARNDGTICYPGRG